MRSGSNPEKENRILKTDSYHRVVIPVYIPNLTDHYFKDGLKILKYCLESLLATTHSKTRITLINNASCTEVVTYLETLKGSHAAIDQLFHSDINLGKVNAIYSAVKSNLESLITISDADVLFLPGWQQATEQVFVDFPKAGMVSPVPSSKAYNTSFLNATLYYGFSTGTLKFKDVKDPDGLVKFQESIGRELYKPVHLQKYLTLSNKEATAVVGCGHFVATMRAQVFEKAPPFPSTFKIVGGSENTYFDIPNDEAGLLRLATHGNYAYHLGNEVEDWMAPAFEESLKTPSEKNTINDQLKDEVKGISKQQQFIGKLIYKLFIRVGFVKRWYFSALGMKDPNY
ncbi:glycosyltransferase family A protein [Constantimarinum furrinae]|uniref:Glycosyltransferase 2-like domain-containing protein n=1 Tax=Constantimarinum furrinae TaxID=2562285 RepID=A0A7G8PQT7_9FLAO|nr:glycosyltransferase family A protein [Constantimarinum furrinae]QNJ96703.1 hypothetical protein ALE3EI_0112 [Constantimarinum furrinae]